jgi:hypothetical protein
VKSELRKCGIAYFSCHSEANRRDPSLSPILLERSTGSREDAPPTRLTAEHPRSGSRGGLPAGRAVVVRVRGKEGSTSDRRGFSIAGAFHMAGVPHSVSGMWQLDDTVAMEVVAVFDELLRGGEWSGSGRNNGQGFDQRAVALQMALQRQRDKGTSLQSRYYRSPYLHHAPQQTPGELDITRDEGASLIGNYKPRSF